jgi:hypothetical protein
MNVVPVPMTAVLFGSSILLPLTDINEVGTSQKPDVSMTVVYIIVLFPISSSSIDPNVKNPSGSVGRVSDAVNKYSFLRMFHAVGE